jgi:hypothetical protein
MIKVVAVMEPVNWLKTPRLVSKPVAESRTYVRRWISGDNWSVSVGPAGLAGYCNSWGV